MRVAILTISDSVFRGERADLSGPALRERCAQRGWQVVAAEIVPDESSTIQAFLIACADSRQADVILTTGGTGLGPRDVTPEATAAVCPRLIPGLGELMRAAGKGSNPHAALSRAVAGVRGQTLIVNLPGSPKGAVESLDAVAALLPHAVDVLRGARHD
ncbi:MAG: MogA/MoaB family molybdenum cofactor biosynthesis protein [Acidobacteria bacterium]|nr:MogA/MoaB family molybdenum cofactor biosynthesis protein [Acidobacteriota bacterium]MBI3662463.1 MogA/MoaB family molybdenum cofactor biosynthesis protein [Acidobacteriota bacterium]